MSTQTFPPSSLDSVNNFTVNHSSREFTPLQATTPTKPLANGTHTSWNRNASVFVPKNKSASTVIKAQTSPETNNDVTNSGQAINSQASSRKIPIIDPKTNQEIDLRGTTATSSPTSSLSSSPSSSSLSTPPLPTTLTNGVAQIPNINKTVLPKKSLLVTEPIKETKQESQDHVNIVNTNINTNPDSNKRVSSAIPIIDPRTKECINGAILPEDNNKLKSGGITSTLEAQPKDVVNKAVEEKIEVVNTTEVKENNNKEEKKVESTTSDVPPAETTATTTSDLKETDSQLPSSSSSSSSSPPSSSTSVEASNTVADSPQLIESVVEEPSASTEPTKEEEGTKETKIEETHKQTSPENEVEDNNNNNVNQPHLKEETKELVENVQSTDASEISEEQKEDKSFSKLIYDRDFLLKFQSTCTEKPENLPVIEVAVGENQTWQRSSQQNNRYRDSSRSTPRSARREQPVPREAPPPPAPRWTGNTKQGDPENETLRKITSLLNKITAENFDSVVKKIQKTTIPTEQTLVLIIDQVFMKAVSEVQFSSLYAQLCVKINETTELKFRELILSKCQREFENRPPTLISPNEKPSEETEELELKRRQRIFGNMRFIGELFNKRVLHPVVILQCLSKLVSVEPIENIPSEDIECLCLLLKTSGLRLEESGLKYKTQLNLTFDRIIAISKANVHGHRIHFALMDLIDLKNNGWNVAKAKEDAKKSMDAQERAKEKVKEKETSVRPSNKSSNIEPSSPSTDEWKSTARPKNTQKKKDDRKAAPQPPQPSPKDSKKDSQKPSPSNPFNLLEGSKPSPNAPPKKSGKGQSKSQPKQTQENKAQNQQPPAAPQLTKEEMESKLDLIIEEYLASGESDDAVEYVKKLNIPKELLPAAFQKILFILIETTKETAKKDLISLFSLLAQQNIFAPQHYATGFRELFETLEDLAIDVPLAPDNAASLFAQSVVGKTIELSYLKEFSPIWTASSLGQKFFSVTLKQLLALTNEENVKELLRESNIKAAEFMPEYDNSSESTLAFLNKHSLSFLSDIANESS